MARRRQKQNDIELMPLVLLMLLAIIGYLSQNGGNPILIMATILITVVTICLIVVLIRKNKQELLSKSGITDIDTMSGIEFEKYLKALLERRGYTNVTLTPTYDMGVDLIAKKDGQVWAIQAKRYKGLVGLEAVRQVVAAINYYKCDRSMVVTNSYFTRNAQLIAQSAQCTLIDRDALIKLILESNIPTHHAKASI